MKYRIVSNGYKYRIQRRGWFGWKNLCAGDIEGYYGYIREFDMLELARTQLNEMMDKEKANNSKFVSVEEYGKGL